MAADLVSRRLAVVGPCAAGKSTLAAKLRQRGYTVREPAQEHSMVPDMWRRLSRPDILIYLDVSLETIHRRGRTGELWEADYLAEEHHRLRHARQHCDFYLCTDQLTPEQVLGRVLGFLNN
jgi:deoxyadenosine/deoxycytidine kinase